MVLLEVNYQQCFHKEAPLVEGLLIFVGFITYSNNKTIIT